MTSITIELPEERVQQLQQRATELGISLDELIQLSIVNLLARPSDDVMSAIRYVLIKNAELYHRLA
jgi:hypothetical protein